MDRQDSGYSETIQPRSTRTSMSSTGRQSPSKREQKRRTTNTSINSTTRPPTKRASRSTPSAIITRTSTSPNSSRPAPQTRHTHGQSYQQQPAYQFFHFPTFTEPHAQEEEEATVASALVPPATVQYWTSDSTRRLEYAAIDAASKGVKGFFIKLVPDCILPPASRRPRFCEGDDGDSNLGSVRRYRLDLPEEKCPRGGRKGLWRRWSSGWGRRRGSC
ncbi:hypothetical protein BJ875DRAFT_507905 [Amylocarpus encephaloides]|uniref:Uncharacterized protein n=1 Tax=Amylocarpus encephaloides TaxID=45428 RepID=A0A9P7Y9F7_9HELO|nr:hypothetical protein BJ875DRAFT_507905 [Amylocarpus encephaloides]